MSEISRSALFGKLNSVAFKAIESATVFCKLRGNPYVELVHWISQILQSPDSDMHRILRHFELDLGVLDPHRDRGRARLGLRQPDVRRFAGAHRPSDGRHDEDAVAAQRAD